MAKIKEVCGDVYVKAVTTCTQKQMKQSNNTSKGVKLLASEVLLELKRISDKSTWSKVSAVYSKYREMRTAEEAEKLRCKQANKVDQPQSNALQNCAYESPPPSKRTKLEIAATSKRTSMCRLSIDVDGNNATARRAVFANEDSGTLHEQLCDANKKISRLQDEIIGMKRKREQENTDAYESGFEAGRTAAPFLSFVKHHK